MTDEPRQTTPRPILSSIEAQLFVANIKSPARASKNAPMKNEDAASADDAYVEHAQAEHIESFRCPLRYNASGERCQCDGRRCAAKITPTCGFPAGLRGLLLVY